MPYLDPRDPRHSLNNPMDDRTREPIVNNQFKPHEVQEYLRTRLGNSAAVRQVGKDMQLMVNRWYAWAAAEIATLKQELEEQEIEHELSKNEMPQWKVAWAADNLNYKKWRNTNDESDPY